MPKRSIAVEPSRAKQLLVVDGDAQMRELYRLALESNGYQVTLAGDAASARALYAQAAAGQGFSLVILDMCLPDMAGPDCARDILAMDPQARVIIATGDCEPDLRELMDSVTAVLAKPISLRVLLQEITSCLDAGGRRFAAS